jgi:hypothetical protein
MPITKGFHQNSLNRSLEEKMSFSKWANNKVSNLTWVDIALTKWSVFAFALMIAKLWPHILRLKWYWYALICIVLAIIPFKNFWKD